MLAIITPQEVINLSTTSQAMDKNLICKVLGIEESSFFCDTPCLGSNFYETLLADIFTPSPVLDFNPTASYPVGTFIRYVGLIYKVDTATAAGERPDGTGAHKFVMPKKFNNPYHNEIWGNFLANIVAYKVQIFCMEDSFNGLHTSAGLNVVEGDNFKRSSTNNIERKVGNIKAQIEKYTNRLTEYLSKNADKFPTAGFSQKACSTDKSNSCQTAGQTKLWRRFVIY